MIPRHKAHSHSSDLTQAVRSHAISLELFCVCDSGGEGGYERLALLARTRWLDTAALFARAGLSPGMRCIDVGCGGGQVTLEIARLVSPDGSAVGVDMDEVKLGLARQAAAEAGLTNVEFRQLNARDWDEPGSYDAVYSRFLLQHLSEPVDMLGRMWAAVRHRGVLIVEEADFDGWCCEPASEGKTLAWSTLEASAATIVAERVATQDEVTAAITTSWQFTADPQTLISGPRIFQLWSGRLRLPRFDGQG